MVTAHPRIPRLLRYTHICRFCGYLWASKNRHPRKCANRMGCGHAGWEDPKAALQKERQYAAWLHAGEAP